MQLIAVELIRVENRFRRHLGNVSALMDSIKALGLLHPVLVNQDYRLIAGGRRLEACKRLGWKEIPARVVTIDELRAQHDENVIREDFLPSEAVAIKRALEQIERAKARERMSEGGRLGRKGVIRGVESAHLMAGKTRDKLAAYVGMSHFSLQRAEEVVAAAELEPEKYGDLLEEMDSKRRSVNGVYQKLKARQKTQGHQTKLPRMPPDLDAMILFGDCRETLKSIRSQSVSLVVSSCPYNLGKEYEKARSLDAYLEDMVPVLEELCRVLTPKGSLCWQTGNHVENGEVFPLDILFYPVFKELGFKLRNRIIWHFRHGLHASNRFAGRYETLLWFSKGDDYTFDLDAVRVPSKYPDKRQYKPGQDYGALSGNPLGKNPSDLWEILTQEWETGLWDIPNVKANHPEKTEHPCQFPVELVERLVLALTNEGNVVLDPFGGVGSALIAAVKHRRRGVMCEWIPEYIDVARKRLSAYQDGNLRLRPLARPVYQPAGSGR
jgi:adenine-specific DNA-methyltransferase